MRTPILAVFLTGIVWSVRASVAVLTQHNDHARTGANLQETLLNVTNVNLTEFGLVFTRAVDDQIYAQPLVMTNVNIPGKGPRIVVYVATVNDSVYAFDAEETAASAPYWQVSFTNANAVAPRNTDMTGACGGNYKDFSGNIGIVGTPVIDPAQGTIYLVARTKEFGTNFVQRLHALDLSTGAERSNSPVVITATYPGNGDGSVGGVITFDPQRQNQRPGLALVNGVVYIGWASHCDWGPYHGWLMGYNATNLQRVVVYNTTPNGYNGGIWMGGQAPAADPGGNLYLSVGNGSVGYNGNPRDTINRGESFLKLTPNGTPSPNLASWFTPYNWQTLENGDIDLGSAGILLIPGTTLALSGGKEGKAYLVNRDNMGGLSGTAADTNIIQSFQVSSREIFGSPVWWDGPAYSSAYLWGSADYLRQYKFDVASGMFLLPNYAQSPTPAPSGEPGGILALSANGATAGSGIVWASHQFTGDANQQVRPGILHAYNAQNVTNELWNSEQLSARDSVGNFAKFCPPTVANGKVYLATFSNRLNVYGLLSLVGGGTNPPNANITAPTNNSSFLAPASFTITATASVTDSNRTLATLDFFDGTNLLATQTSPPYMLARSNVTAGAHYLTVKATDSNGAYRISSPVTVLVSAPPGTGTGLIASYFNNQTLTIPPALTRVDATINFDWGAGSPSPAIGADHFSVRWMAYVQPQFSETYSFYTMSDDGVRLWVNNMLIIDNWTDHGATEDSGTLPLVAGQKYAIKMEFYENGGAALAQLSWSSPSTPKAIIPQSQLFNYLPTLTVAATADAQEGTGQPGRFTVTRSGDASDSLMAAFTLTGSATFGTDYSLDTAGNQVFFTNSQTIATVAVNAVNDLVVEGNETVQLTLAGSLNYFLGAPSTATLTILDSPFDQWRVTQFGSLAAAQGADAAPGADWDHDGIGNYLEYALGLNPTVADTNALPKVRLSVDAGQRYLTLDTARNGSALDLDYRVGISSDLSNWFFGPPYTVELTNTPATLSVRDAQPVSANPSRFLRLEVTPRP